MEEVQEQTGSSHGTVQRIITDHLNLKKVTARYISKDLTDFQRAERVRICQQNLAKFQEGTWRLCDVITGDESWFCHTQIGRKSSNAAKLINSFENLSNELLYEIFDYLDAYAIYKVFSNLNTRFQALLASSSLRLKIDLRFHSQDILQYCSTHIVTPNKDKIISIIWPYFYDYESNFTLFNIDSSFNRLDSLTLRDIESNQLIKGEP
ncbi:unnamed protein product [Rotaria sp. Silwood2]|nr:unnamed protein product [Rotaria sp. Silwood2]CAF4315025.1 unnamed protein product [Rotaria sp. Silwood2]